MRRRGVTYINARMRSFSRASCTRKLPRPCVRQADYAAGAVAQPSVSCSTRGYPTVVPEGTRAEPL